MKSKQILANIDPYTYSISVRRILVGGELLFKGTVAELPDVATFEATFEDAYTLAIDAIESLYESSVEENRTFPSAFSQTESSEYSGRLTLRMPKWLHAQLGGQAEAEGISLNQYLISILSAAGSINAIVYEASERISRNFFTQNTAVSRVEFGGEQFDCSLKIVGFTGGAIHSERVKSYLAGKGNTWIPESGSPTTFIQTDFQLPRIITGTC